MMEKMASVFSAAYDKLFQEKWDDLSPEAREFHSGMSAQLQNLIVSVGELLEVQDWNQWYYDCGMRICGTPQVGTCEWCERGE